MDGTLPASPGDLTAEWLSRALSESGSLVVVRSVVAEPVGTGQTGATYRIAVEYAENRRDLPATFVVKLPSQDQDVRQRVSLGYRSEYAFYTEVVDTVRVPTPQCFHLSIDNGGADFVMLLADLSPAVQGDQIQGCSDAEAVLAVEALAGLHAPRWCDPAWLEFTGTVMPHPDDAMATGMGELTSLAVQTTLEQLGERIAEEDRATLVDSAALVANWLLIESDRYCLLHGDYRLDNLLFDPDRTRVTVVDWQTLAVGLPARDLAYFIGTSVLPTDRAILERGLVAAYHEALLAHGVAGFDEATCWRDYRLGMLQIPLISTLGFAFSASTERGDDMMLAMLARGCRAIRELGTLALIREWASAT
jgi:aminoglycoside phosphotransferase (APT) family kinase protein